MSKSYINLPIGKVRIIWKEGNPPQLIQIDLPPFSESKSSNVSSPPEAIKSFFLNFFCSPGEIADFSIVCKHTSAFYNKILETLRRSVPAGKVVHYQKLAEIAGYPGAARAVGSVMAKNSLPLYYPCHRVVLKSRFPGPFQKVDPNPLKIRMLELEGIGFEKSGRILERYFVG